MEQTFISLFYAGVITDAHLGIPQLEDERERLMLGVEEYGKRVYDLTKVCAAEGSVPLLLGGGHNLNLPFTKAISDALKEKLGKKPSLIEIQLDLHGDCRVMEPTGTAKGEHSGNHNRVLLEEGVVDKAYFLGLDWHRNNQNIVDFITSKKDHIEVHPIDHLQLSFEEKVRAICKDIHTKYPDHQVVLTICGDTIAGMPTSAGTNVTGLPAEHVKQLVRLVAENTKLAGVNVAEINKFLALELEKAANEGGPRYPWQYSPQDIGVYYSELMRVLMMGLKKG